MRNVIFLTIAAVLIAGAASRFVAKLDATPSQSIAGAPAPAPKPTSASANMLVVPGDRSGHFRVDSTIGGRSVKFLVDTGATIVALTKSDADRLGINPSPRDFKVRMQTANGIVAAAQVRLAAVTVGSLTVHDVSAVVMPEGALAQNLLGMSFLSRLRRFEFRTGQLVLEQ